MLAQVIDGEGDAQKIVARKIKPRLKEIAGDPEFADEAAALKANDALLARETKAQKAIKAAEETLAERLHATYPHITATDARTFVIHDKWLAALAAVVDAELERVSQTATRRIRELAERYAEPCRRLQPKSNASPPRWTATCGAWVSPGPTTRRSRSPYLRVAEDHA